MVKYRSACRIDLFLMDCLSYEFCYHLIALSQVIYPAMRWVIWFRIMEYFKISSIRTFSSYFLTDFPNIKNSYLRLCFHSIKYFTVNSLDFSNLTISIWTIEIF